MQTSTQRIGLRWLQWALGMACCALNCVASAASPMVSLGETHAVALRSDGKVMTWGGDEAGQLGSGRLPFATTASRIEETRAFRAIGVGVSHSLAVATDGAVWAWGANDSGQLGGGGGANRTSPGVVNGISGVSQVCGGMTFSLALKTDGTVWAWGSGALGSEGAQSAELPRQAPLLANVASIACGNTHALALGKDGTVWAWGENDEGQIGDGTTSSRTVPTQLPGLSGVKSVAAGNLFSAALKQDGTVWEWGVRDAYASPRGTPRKSPTLTAGLSGIVEIAASVNDFRLVAVQADRQTWWKWPTGTAPVAQETVGSTRAVAYGYGGVLLLKTDATVLAGGEGAFGGLGDGTTNYREVPGPVLGLANITQVATGNWHSLALDNNGRIWTWGLDVSGQLGMGRTQTRSIPGEVAGLSRIVQLDAGKAHTHAVDEDGAVWAWGDNGYGQFGNGNYLSSSTPVRLTTVSNIKAVAAGSIYTLALARDGALYQWGSMIDNQFAAPATPNLLLNNVIAMAAGPVHALAVTTDGTVWAWGANDKGQLGDGTTLPQARPRRVAGLAGVRQVAASENSNYALLADGSVLAWGANARGQLGDGTLIERVGVVAVQGLNGVVDISAGSSHLLARTATGAVWGWSWDYQDSGELGQPAARVLAVPAPVAELADIQAIAAGVGVSAFVRKDGQVLMGGKNTAGQLGDGTLAQRSSLGLVVNIQADGFFSIGANAVTTVASSLAPPFFVTTQGGINDKRASVSTNTRFNAVDRGRTGSVYVTARVPAGALGSPAPAANPGARPRTSGTPATPFTLIQLTPTGWQSVSEGQLLPYASGVLGDQLAAQKILDATDTTALKGAEFCVGYGTSAQDMLANGNMRPVASIPGATSNASCVVGSTSTISLKVVPGWNLLGNPIHQSIAVASRFGDVNVVNSVWKWDNASSRWQFFSPALTASALADYTAQQGFGTLSTVEAGDGFWVHAKASADLGTLSGNGLYLRPSSLPAGWSLVATANTVSASQLNLNLSTTPPLPGQVPINLTSLWAWDSGLANWYFYAPVLEAQGGTALKDYLRERAYLDFGTQAKSLGSATGFWVNRP